MIIPNTDIYLIKSPLERDNLHQLTFNNINEQEQYFDNLPKLSLDNSTYQRENNYISYPGKYDDIIMYNYCKYRNTNYGDKWFYAFITNIQYINDNMSRISIDTDYWQTWQFDIQWKKSFVEREHVNNDTIGLHTIPENLETGDYIINDFTTSDIGKFENLDAVLATSVDPVNSTDNEQIFVNGIYQGIPTGTGYYAYRNILNSAGNDITTLRENLQHLTDIGASDAVSGLFLAPQLLTNSSNGIITNSYFPSVYTELLPNITALDGYVPTNKKLFISDYCFHRITNGAGSTIILKPELWDNFTANKQFRIKAAITPGCSIIGYPLKYNGIDESIVDSLTLGKFPELNYTTDSFNNWQTQNAVNVTRDIFFGGIGLTGLLSGEKTQISNGASSFFNIAETLQSVKIADRVPPTFAGNVNCGDVMTSSGYNNFRYETLTIRQEYAKIIDNYFSMFGYKVNDLKIPNIIGRQNWNFVKTIECNIEGEIPQEAILSIKQIFNTGVTLWHNPNNFLNYNVSNNII